MNPIFATPSDQRLGFSEKLAYGLGDTASNFYFQAFNLFLVFYYTDILGLSAAAVGTMMLVARVLDAVLDPIVGLTADRTQTRWGKFRPYILWGAIPYGVAGYLMFANPAVSADGKLLYAYATYIGMWIAYTAINIPYSALMGVMSPSSADRTSLSTYRFVCAFAGALLISSLVLPLINWLGGDDAALGFRHTMAIFSVVSVGLFFFTFLRTRERVQPPPEQDKSLRKDLRDLARNFPWLVLFAVAFLTLTNVGVRNASIIYYFKYVVGDESRATLFMTLGSVVFIAGALATKLWLRVCARRTLMIALTIVNALAIGAFFFVPPQQPGVLHALNVLANFVAGPTPAIVWSMYADTADYGEWKFGRRATGLVFSGVVFAQKVGLAVGSALLAWLLGWFGFVANASQDAHALLGLKLVFSLIPAAFALCSAAALLFYRLDEPQVKRVERELAARKAAAAAAPTPA